jgi:cytochrome c biogenesis protein ResB
MTDNNMYTAGWFLAPVMLLVTGTSVVISAQFINNMASFNGHPARH